MRRGFPILNLGVKCTPGYVPSGDPNKPCMVDPNAPDSPPPVTPPPMEANGSSAYQLPATLPSPGAEPVPISNDQPIEQSSGPVPVVNQAPSEAPPALVAVPSPEGTPRWVNSKAGDLGTTLAATGTIAALAVAGALFLK